MNGPLKEWIGKAEEDYRTALRMSRYRRDPTPSTICFHCQQCVEKYLKACAVRLGQPVLHIHHLERLLDAIVPLLPALQAQRNDLLTINPFGVAPRYPGFILDMKDAAEAVAAMKRVRLVLRQVIGIKRTSARRRRKRSK